MIFLQSGHLIYFPLIQQEFILSFPGKKTFFAPSQNQERKTFFTQAIYLILTLKTTEPLAPPPREPMVHLILVTA